MVTTEPAEATASETRPPGFHIRWGWFLGCIAAGLVAILVGWFVAAPAGRLNYLTGLLLNVGTTLLLLGIVVLSGQATRRQPRPAPPRTPATPRPAERCHPGAGRSEAALALVRTPQLHLP